MTSKARPPRAPTAFKATSGGVTSANSSSVSITAGGVSTLTFSTQPTGPVGEGHQLHHAARSHGQGRQRQHREWGLGDADHRHLHRGHQRWQHQGHARLHQQHGDHREPRGSPASPAATSPGRPPQAPTPSVPPAAASTSANSSTVSITAGNGSALTFSTQPTGHGRRGYQLHHPTRRSRPRTPTATR